MKPFIQRPFQFKRQEMDYGVYDDFGMDAGFGFGGSNFFPMQKVKYERQGGFGGARQYYGY